MGISKFLFFFSFFSTSSKSYANTRNYVFFSVCVNCVNCEARIRQAKKNSNDVSSVYRPDPELTFDENKILSDICGKKNNNNNLCVCTVSAAHETLLEH